MRICVIGGSHGTGAQLATLAAKAGHDIVVLSRRGVAPQGAVALAGSATEVEAVSRAVTDADAVVVTVNGAKGAHHQRAAVTRTVVEAMRGAGVRRLLVQSSLGAGGSSVQLPRAMRGTVPRADLAAFVLSLLTDDAAIGKAFGVSSR